MRYVIARYNYEMRDMAYRFYISEGLFNLNNNVANGCSFAGNGFVMNKKYSDILEEISSRNNVNIKEKKPEEIIEGLKERMRKLK